jgi:hypothetical protein
MGLLSEQYEGSGIFGNPPMSIGDFPYFPVSNSSPNFMPFAQPNNLSFYDFSKND